MAERECTREQSAANALSVGHGALYGPAHVTITEVNVDTKMVTFLAPSTEGSDPVAVTCKWSRDNVFAGCPSKLDADINRLPAANAEGKLYLSRALIADKRIAAKAKWPDADAGTTEYAELRIWPVSIQLRGVELATGDMISKTVELMDPTIADPNQTIKIADEPLSLRLSHVGFDTFRVGWPSLAALAAAKATIDAPDAAAREKASAWAQVAVWEDRVSQASSLEPGGREAEMIVTAKRIINSLRE